MRPQEYGNLTDVRWMALKDSRGNGILIAGYEPLSMRAININYDDMNWSPNTRHACNLRKNSFITVNVDLFQMGVGGDNSWGAPVHKEYTYPAKEYSYTFRIMPFKSINGNESQIVKRLY